MPRSTPSLQQAHHPRRPSISTPMQWLSRNSSKPSAVGLAGATVVRTPEDALRDTNVRVNYDPNARAVAPQPPPSGQPASPPLPPLPLPEEGEAELLGDTPRRPLRSARTAPPAAPSPTPSSSSSQLSNLRPSLKSRSSTAVEDLPQVPPVPSHVPLSAPVAPFAPILVSALLEPDTDPSKLIVTLETCTSSFKSTLSTLCSRPSRLADYLTLLTRHRSSSQASSIYSTESADIETYRSHLTSQGLLPNPSIPASLHIFLDRPSAPYAHVLSFLRSPSSSPECPPGLPRAVQLSSLTHSTSSSAFNVKLDALLELRDESACLGLESLYKLCTDELRQRLAHAPRMHGRGNSQGSINTMIGPGLLPAVGSGPMSIHSQHASVYSLHTLAERIEGDLTATKAMNNRVSRESDSLDDESTPAPAAITRHRKHPSVSSTATSKAASSSSYSPSHSTPNSPPKTYTRPQRHLKSESMSSVPARTPPTPESGWRLPSRDRKKKGQQRSPSPSVGVARAGPLVGWI